MPIIVRQALALFVSLCFCFGLRGQQRKPGVMVGIRGGLHIPNYAIKTMPPNVKITSRDVGYYAGLDISVSLANKLYLQPELGIVGVRIQTYHAGRGLAGDYLGYADLPVLLKLKGRHFGIYAGPVVGVMLFAKDNIRGTSALSISKTVMRTSICRG